MADHPTTLSNTLTKLVRAKRTGLLALEGEFGFRAGIFLLAGEIVLVEDGKLYGAPAAKNIAL